MGGSWHIGTFWGIPLKVHWTFSLLLIYVTVVGRMEGLSGMSMIWFFVLFLALFVCVILHEYGHALAARSYGVRTADILILPIGGLARLEKLPERPAHELVVAIAGPAVNLALLVLGLGYLWLSGQGLQPIVDLQEGPRPEPSNLIPQLILINAALFTFNLVPAFPMDGGRILRSLLAMFYPKTKATAWATRVGMVVSLLFMIIGLFGGNLVLAIVGLVVLYLAQTENRAVRMMDDISRLHANNLMADNIPVVDEWVTLGQIIERYGNLSRQGVVTRDTFGSCTAFIPQAALSAGRKDPALPAYRCAVSFDVSFSEDTGLEEMIRYFSEHASSPAVPVVNRTGQYQGLVLRESIMPYEPLARIGQ